MAVSIETGADFIITAYHTLSGGMIDAKLGHPITASLELKEEHTKQYLNP